MNKSQLVSSIAKQSGLSLKDSTAALNAFLETVKDTLAKNWIEARLNDAGKTGNVIIG